MLAEWQHMFPLCEPIGHRLRATFQTRWVRFHSLPESKRYPENANDHATVLERHNRILGELASSDQTVILLTTAHAEVSDVAYPAPELRSLVPNAQLWRSVQMNDDDGFIDSSYWHVFASEHEWRSGVFDTIIRMVVDQELINVILVHLTVGGLSTRMMEAWM